MKLWKDAVCSDLKITLSDHLPQFLIMPSTFQTLYHPNPMSMKEVGQILIKKSLYWAALNKIRTLFLMLKKNYVNYSFDNFLLNMHRLLETQASFKKVIKYQLKLICLRNTLNWNTPWRKVKKMIEVLQKITFNCNQEK